MTNRILIGLSIGCLIAFCYLVCNKTKPDNKDYQSEVTILKSHEKHLIDSIESLNKALLVKNALLADQEIEILSRIEPKKREAKQEIARLKPIIDTSENRLAQECFELVLKQDSIIQGQDSAFAIEHERRLNTDTLYQNEVSALDTSREYSAKIEVPYREKIKADSREIRKLKIANTVILISGVVVALGVLLKP